MDVDEFRDCEMQTQKNQKSAVSVKSVLPTLPGLGLIAGDTYVPRWFHRVAKSRHVINTDSFKCLFWGILSLHKHPLATFIYLLFVILQCRCLKPERLRNVEKEVGVLSGEIQVIVIGVTSRIFLSFLYFRCLMLLEMRWRNTIEMG